MTRDRCFTLRVVGPLVCMAALRSSPGCVVLEPIDPRADSLTHALPFLARNGNAREAQIGPGPINVRFTGDAVIQRHPGQMHVMRVVVRVEGRDPPRRLRRPRVVDVGEKTQAPRARRAPDVVKRRCRARLSQARGASERSDGRPGRDLVQKVAGCASPLWGSCRETGLHRPFSGPPMSCHPRTRRIERTRLPLAVGSTGNRVDPRQMLRPEDSVSLRSRTGTRAPGRRKRIGPWRRHSSANL